jgi:hypothetical protein
MAQDAAEDLKAAKAAAAAAEHFDASVKGESHTDAPDDAATIAKGVHWTAAAPYSLAHDARVKTGEAAPPSEAETVAKGVTWKKEQKSAPAQSDVDKVASGIRWKPQQ